MTLLFLMHFTPHLTQVNVPLFHNRVFQNIHGRMKKIFEKGSLFGLLFVFIGLEYHVKLIKVLGQPGLWIIYVLGLIPFEGIE